MGQGRRHQGDIVQRESVGPRGAAILNRVPTPLFSGLSAAPLQTLLTDSALGESAHAALERQAMEQGAMQAVVRLEQTGLPVVALFELRTETFGLTEVEALSQALIPPPKVVEAL